MKGMRISDHERSLWVNNDEFLHLEWKRSKLGMFKWIRGNRPFIDRVIKAAWGRKPDADL